MYDGNEGDDPWIGKFMPGRKERIENDAPYVAIDFQKILGRARR
jgi:hypothetical protein